MKEIPKLRRQKVKTLSIILIAVLLPTLGILLLSVRPATSTSGISTSAFVLPYWGYIKVHVQSSYTSCINSFGVFSIADGSNTPNETIFWNINHYIPSESRPLNDPAIRGPYPPGKIVFMISHPPTTYQPGATYYSPDGKSNPDGLVHCRIIPTGSYEWELDWEDSNAGRYRSEDFTDLIVDVSENLIIVSISPTQQSVENGTHHEYAITIVNNENLLDNYNLTVSDTAGWSPSISPTSLLNVSPGENRTATLSVTIPSGAVAGTIDTITVTATSQENTTLSDSDSCTALVSVYTPPGGNVQVIPVPNVNVTFSTVTVGGDTAVTTSTNGPDPPTGYIVGYWPPSPYPIPYPFPPPPTYYNITTTATYSGTTAVCISYCGPSGGGERGISGQSRLMHWNGSGWDDITTSVDTVDNKIYGTTTSLSTFIIANPTPSPVGGIALPPDKLALLAPYIILAALIAIATVSVAVPWRRYKK